MTIQQLQYVLEISKTGSVSKAARNLYLSQPNLSNAIKNLENELGITIFDRTPMGMQLTVSGRKLVQKASSIMEDIREITMAQHQEETASFRLVYPRYVLAFEAFRELCRRYQEHPYLQFSCYIGDGEKQIEALYRNLCDLVIYLDYGTSSFRRTCADFHVQFVPLMKPQLCVQVSEDHPLLKEPVFEVKRLKDYPYVAFADLNDWNAGWTPWEDIVNPNRLIRVQSTSSRVSMVAHTQAYSIVLPHSEEYNRANHVVQIPFENKPLSLGYLYSLDREMSGVAEEYIELLKKMLIFQDAK